jgi:hypothetical protein
MFGSEYRSEKVQCKADCRCSLKDFEEAMTAAIAAKPARWRPKQTRQLRKKRKRKQKSPEPIIAEKSSSDSDTASDEEAKRTPADERLLLENVLIFTNSATARASNRPGKPWCDKYTTVVVSDRIEDADWKAAMQEVRAFNARVKDGKKGLVLLLTSLLHWIRLDDAGTGHADARCAHLLAQLRAACPKCKVILNEPTHNSVKSEYLLAMRKASIELGGDVLDIAGQHAAAFCVWVCGLGVCVCMSTLTLRRIRCHKAPREPLWHSVHGGKRK